MHSEAENVGAQRIERPMSRRSGCPALRAASSGWLNLALLCLASLTCIACGGSDGGGIDQTGSGGGSGDGESSISDVALAETASEHDGRVPLDGPALPVDGLDASADAHVADGRAPIDPMDAALEGMKPDAPEPFCEAWSYPIDEGAGCFGDLRLVCVRDLRFEVCPEARQDGGDTIDRNCEPVLVCMISPEDEVYVVYNFGWAEVLPDPGWRLSAYFEQASMLTGEEELRCEAALRYWRKPCR